ncbi:MAG: aminotransferase class V-fold PLP-dependent enzyme, partial [Bacteroidales bacterium]
MDLDINKIRKDFPALHQLVYKKPLVYFDNAATTQKPKVVIDTLLEYYNKQNSNIHRGVHYLSQQATSAYEEARRVIQKFINAQHSHEIIFTRGTTESINLVASSFAKKFLKNGDEIVISAMEHHSNIVPWQMVCEEKHSVLKVIPINDAGELMLEEFEKLLNEKTKLIAISHISNALGTINPIKEIIKTAHSKNIPVLVDGAQAVPHMKIDVKDLDC